MGYRRYNDSKVKPIALPTAGQASQRAKDTISHLEKGWLPVEQDLLAGINANLKNSHYKDNSQALVEDLQKDPALFFTVCRRLRTFSDINVAGFDPFDLLEKLEEEQLKQVFDFDPADYSKHRSWDETPSQELVHNLCRISGESAESISKELKLDANVAHQGSLFRLIGLELISWNYPKLFSQALSAQKLHNASLDQEIKKYFDITPQQIGARFARELEMSREIKQTLIPVPDRITAAVKDIKKALRITDVCALSEIFAKSTEASYFPEAEIEWAAKEGVLRPILGEDLFDSLHTIASKVQTEDTSATDFGDLKDHITKGKQQASDLNLTSSNRYISKCNEDIKRAFTGIYIELDRSKNALDAIKLLVTRAIPETGVIRGCVYLQRKSDYTLQAALRFGSVPLTSYQRFLKDSRNGIIEAMKSQAPYSKQGTGVTGESIFQVRGNLGADAASGVLYIEIEEKLVKEPDFNPLLIFHLIRNTVADCLKSIEEGDKSRMSFY